MRKRCIVPGAYSAFSMRWRDNYWDEEIASADFAADMTNRHEGRLDINMNERQQTIFLVPRSSVWRLPMVLRMATDEPLLFSFVDATWCNSFSLPTRVG
jgi:hypothetical protein